MGHDAGGAGDGEAGVREPGAGERDAERGEHEGVLPVDQPARRGDRGDVGVETWNEAESAAGDEGSDVPGERLAVRCGVLHGAGAFRAEG